MRTIPTFPSTQDISAVSDYNMRHNTPSARTPTQIIINSKLETDYSTARKESMKWNICPKDFVKL